VTGGPDVAKSFASAIPPGGTTVLTITLSNPNATTPLSSLAFTDTYPANVTNAAVPAVGTTCGGTVTAAAGGPSVALSGGSLAAGANCTVTVSVTGSAPGDYVNIIPSGGVTSNVAPNSTAALATLSVLPPPVVTKTFTPNSVALNAYTTLTITLTNPSSTPMTGVAFTDSYPTIPAALTNRFGGTLTNTCGGAAARTTAAPYTLSLAGGTIPANGSCTVSYNRVRVNTAGAYTNTIPVGGVTTTNAGSNTVAASDILSVGNIAIDKAFAPNSIATNASSTLTFTITNSTGANRVGLTFTDTYPAGLVNATPLVAGGTCVSARGGTITAVAGGNSVTLNPTTINLPNNGTCTVTVDVTSAAGGSYTNTLAAGALTATGGFSSAVATTDTLTVLSPPTVAKAFSPNLIGVGASSTMTITLTNPNATAITGAAFTDTYPASLVNNGGLVNNCGGSTTAGASTLTFTGGTIPANGSCTISILVTSATANTYTNTLANGSVTTTNAGSNVAAASANLSVFAAPSITLLKSVAVYSDPLNGTTNPKYIPGAIAEYTITASNSGGPADANSIYITDLVPPNTSLFVNDISGAGSGPVQFIQGGTSSTLTYTFTALNSTTDDLSFSNNSGSTWIAVPVAGANGCDPAINAIRINPKGTFIGNTPTPSFQLKFRVCVQ
jgi:uncharacterized repeat protein (TIGR01451 family)